MLNFKYLGLWLVTTILVSSAFKTSLTFLVVILGSSFIQKRKNNGPRVEPCGNPHLTFFHPEVVLLWVFLLPVTLWYLFSIHCVGLGATVAPRPAQRSHTPQVQNMLPNTDHAHNKHNWTIIHNFNQVQVITPWWWILCDLKHVGVFLMCVF